ncbi:unnamed protein product [Mycena citricolor]|uniref:EF-hand domain-containing protein n=1 Tax=Mycena citricolor TaxID=2018698 RepID=A0AAD2K3T9_9AGAR|nr:unnamed protein product [Mycena citricolor]
MPPHAPAVLESDPESSNHQRPQPPHGYWAEDVDVSSQLLPRSEPPLSDDEEVPASPPYKRQASRSNLTARDGSPSPSYRSRSVWNPDRKDGFAANDEPDSEKGTDDEDNDSDYDWLDEDDLVDAEAKFEERMGAHAKPTGWGMKRRVPVTCRSTFLAAVLVAPALILHFFWYNKDKSEYRHRVILNVQAWLFWAAANLLISWYLAMIVDIVPSLVRLVIAVAWGHVSEYIKSRIEMYNSIKNTLKPILYAASAWVSWLIIFDHIFQMHPGDGRRPNSEAYTDTVYQVVEFFFFLTLVLCLQRLLSQLVAFAFHRTAFKDRIEAVSETLAVVEQLRNHRPKSKRSSGFRTPLFGGFGSPTVESSHKDGFHFISSKLKDHKRRAENESVDAEAREGSPSGSRSRPLSSYGDDHRYPPSRDTRDVTLVGTAAKVLKDAVLHDARNIQGTDAIADMDWNVTSAAEAKRLARAIYTSLKSSSRNYLTGADFRPAFPTAEAAEAAFRVFDSDNNGDLSRAEIKTTLLKVYKERRFLARSMRDVGAALRTLDQLLFLFALVIQFFISLSVFGVNITSSLSSVYTLGIGASFIFKTAASAAFDSIMFLFVTHPFDTGDRCIIDNEIVVVKKMTLFATIFQRSDGAESYYFNSQLAAKFITNVRRSGKTFENLTMQVAWRTPLAKLDALETAINSWLSTEQNRWFVPSTSIMIQKVAFQQYVEFTMAIGHNGTWQDWSLRNARKTAFHAAVQHYCRELGIDCYQAPQPVIWGDPNLSLPPYPTPASPHSGYETEAAAKMGK